tara:strand:- start:827 stop:2074 length:1248 start_codon:yes stop_codon:yes gene_type:complete
MKKYKSKLSKYDNQIKELLISGSSPAEISEIILKGQGKNKKEGIRSRALRIKKAMGYTDPIAKLYANESKSETKPNDYKPIKSSMTALKNGKPMDIDEYCEFYGLDRSMVTSGKLVTHSGVPYWNLVFKENKEDEKDYTEIFDKIKDSLNKIPGGTRLPNKGRTGFVAISDIHMGAWVRNIDGCPDFDMDILTKKLNDIANRINSMRYDNVVVFFLGDYIEGVFSKHKSSWQGMENGLFGAEMLITATETLHKALLSNIDNLQDIYSVSGNHDCLSPDKNDDPDYGAGRVIMQGLKWMGYPVNHKNHVNTFQTNHHCFILNHADHFKNATPESMVLRFGVQGKMNIIIGGHYHSRKIKTNFSFMEVDSADVRKYTIASVFTGNTFSSNLGFTSTSGFSIFEEFDSQLTFSDITIK